jgi:hypothetical protein
MPMRRTAKRVARQAIEYASPVDSRIEDAEGNVLNGG